jgi:hypothetical protein
MPTELKTLIGQEVRVRVTREPFGDYFMLWLENGHTEELEPDATRKWFKDHGVTDDEGLEKGLDTAWNFYEHIFTIENFQVPLVVHPKYAVQI